MATVNTETGEIIEDEDAPGEPEEAADEPREDFEPHDGTRCEAVTTVGGTAYQCALDENHDGEHSFQPIEDEDAPEPSDEAREQNERIKKLAKRADSYSKSVVELLGEDLDGLIACELCSDHGFPGLRYPLAIPAEVVAKLRTLVGLPALDNFKQGTHTETCSVCDGQGKVLTGSRIEKYATMTCQRCEGYGYLIDGVPVKQRVDQIPPAPESLDAEALLQAEPKPEVDPWGRAKGDPDYGRMPGYES